MVPQLHNFHIGRLIQSYIQHWENLNILLHSIKWTSMMVCLTLAYDEFETGAHWAPNAPRCTWGWRLKFGIVWVWISQPFQYFFFIFTFLGNFYVRLFESFLNPKSRVDKLIQYASGFKAHKSTQEWSISSFYLVNSVYRT